MNRAAIVFIVALSSVGFAENGGVAEDSTQQSGNSGELCKVQDTNQVDEKTLQGWKTWRALACERCHGPEQEGLVGPSLIESMKTLSREDFRTTIMEGRPEKGMPPFKTSPMVTQNWEGLYAYLKCRSEGKIPPGRLTAIGQQ